MLSRLSLVTLLLALPLVAAQGPAGQPPPGQPGQGSAPGPQGGDEAPKGPDNIPTPDDKPGDETQPDYPQWVTNDYPCVIECCQGFNGADMSREPNFELEQSTRQCVTDKCNKDSLAENLYQTAYIIQMFYKTGSIYECDGKPCTPEGEAPASTASSGQGGVHSATPAVSIPGVTNGETAVAGESTVVETATATDPNASEGTNEGTAAAESTTAGNGASRTAWGVGVALAAIGVAIGAVGVL